MTGLSEEVLLPAVGVILIIGLILIAAGLAGNFRTRRYREERDELDGITVRYRRRLLDEEEDRQRFDR